MFTSQKLLQSVALMVIFVLASVRCQENESLEPAVLSLSKTTGFNLCFSNLNKNYCILTFKWRAVTEHQLMHDRGQAMQSLKRLIWLFSAMEGLHTAQTRMPLQEATLGCRNEDSEQPLQQLGRGNRGRKTSWNIFPRPRFTGLSAAEK